MSAKKKPAADEVVKHINLSNINLNPGGEMERFPSAAHRKLTVSLFPADLDAADVLMELLRRHCGAVATRSDAVKLGLRIAAAAANPETVKQHYAIIKSEDGRNRGKV